MTPCGSTAWYSGVWWMIKCRPDFCTMAPCFKAHQSFSVSGQECGVHSLVTSRKPCPQDEEHTWFISGLLWRWLLGHNTGANSIYVVQGNWYPSRRPILLYYPFPDWANTLKLQQQWFWLCVCKCFVCLCEWRSSCYLTQAPWPWKSDIVTVVCIQGRYKGFLGHHCVLKFLCWGLYFSLL